MQFRSRVMKRGSCCWWLIIVLAATVLKRSSTAAAGLSYNCRNFVTHIVTTCLVQLAICRSSTCSCQTLRSPTDDCSWQQKYHVCAGAMAHRLQFRVTVLVLATVIAVTTSASPASADYSSGASVNILNAGFDPILVHCKSKDSDLGAYPVAPGANYSWEFSPNIFGMTLYTCEFFWKTFTQNFQVWKGRYYDTRPPCSSAGPCNYKVTSDGFYYGLQSYGTALNTTTASDQLWAFYQPWLPLNASQLFPH